VPRVGQEVLVSFVGGDPDQPIITGRVFNALNPVPVRLPEHNTQSAWRSATTPGGDGFTEPKPWMRRRHVSRMCSRSMP
jgi:type VI secretion system secreted protein VgrG